MNSRPAYRNPWFWLVAGLPLSAVIASLASVYLAVHNADAPVVAHAYQEGEDIDHDIDRQNQAKKLGLSADITLDPSTTHMLIVLHAKHELNDEGISLILSHPEVPALDVHPVLLSSGEHRFEAQLPAHIYGRRYFELSTPKWRLVKEISFPFTMMSIQAR